MKIIGLFVLALVSFVLTLVGALSATGNLSKEGLERLFEGRPAAAPAAAEKEDELDPILRALKKREAAVKQREGELAEREQRLKLRERDLDEIRDELTQAYTQFVASLDEADDDYEVRLQEAATSIESMKPKNAAEVLRQWPPDEAARILAKVQERVRGKILDEMDPDKAALFLRALQERVY
ncbi:MAG: hypothetical protein JXR94_10075 [Candidatus Hydrogenedentes bacterium]|nr:hypothetical protein [Candidatus Hydrogenedentota bacterium]